MTLQAQERPLVATGGAYCVPAAVLDNLAARVRSCGLFLMLLDKDGSVVSHDAQAAMFFQRYVLPLVQYGDPTDPGLVDRIRKLDAASPVTVWNTFPGVILAVFPCVERRQVGGFLVLAARSVDFNLAEEVLRVCSRLGLDAAWLRQQAEELIPYNDEAIQRQARLVTGMFKDQMRLAGLASEMNSLSGHLADAYEELSLIYQISGGMRINRPPNDFFKQACLDVLEVMGVQGLGVALSGQVLPGHEPVLYGALSLPPGTVHRLAEQLIPMLHERKGPLLVNDLDGDKSLDWLAKHVRQLMAVPLQRQDMVMGCLFALNKSGGDFDSQDSKLLNSIANQSAIYLENAILFDDSHGLMMGLLHSLTSAVDAKDAYTCGHSERVALLGRQLSLEAGMGEAFGERVYMTGLLHDVGKIGVPEGVLQKTGRLTPEEFEQMKKHPEIGARILQDIKQISDLIPGVLHHHERFDGRGYPAGLIAENIPLMGRIICLADCFDAMTSNRTYRKAMPLEVALTEIRRCSGTQFDPSLTEAFLRIGAEKFRQLLDANPGRVRHLGEMQQNLRCA
ncbi:MAG: HD domain-containing phosphohydrolase [Tepidisphaeraceae bacterium]|jgi:HD-GYP domain-containing protein (c-di-GMP phosphodiesterase class II)